MHKATVIAGILIGGFALQPALAEPPDLQSGTPVVYLADNLDEKDKLGWCLDTKGRGFNEDLHAHSCKPASRGISDTQFAYNADSGQLRSVPFEGKCMTLRDPSDTVFPFALLDCTEDAASQRFDYEQSSMEIRMRDDATLCVVVAPTSTAAGPFMSRDLLIANCGTVEEKFKQWVVVN